FGTCALRGRASQMPSKNSQRCSTRGRSGLLTGGVPPPATAPTGEERHHPVEGHAADRQRDGAVVHVPGARGAAAGGGAGSPGRGPHSFLGIVGGKLHGRSIPALAHSRDVFGAG